MEEEEEEWCIWKLVGWPVVVVRATSKLGTY